MDIKNQKVHATGTYTNSNLFLVCIQFQSNIASLSWVHWKFESILEVPLIQPKTLLLQGQEFNQNLLVDIWIQHYSPNYQTHIYWMPVWHIKKDKFLNLNLNWNKLDVKSKVTIYHHVEWPRKIYLTVTIKNLQRACSNSHLADPVNRNLGRTKI